MNSPFFPCILFLKIQYEQIPKDKRKKISTKYPVQQTYSTRARSQSRSLVSASFQTVCFDCSRVPEYAKIRTVLQSNNHVTLHRATVRRHQRYTNKKKTQSTGMATQMQQKKTALPPGLLERKKQQQSGVFFDVIFDV